MPRHLKIEKSRVEFNEAMVSITNAITEAKMALKYAKNVCDRAGIDGKDFAADVQSLDQQLDSMMRRATVMNETTAQEVQNTLNDFAITLGD